MFSQILSNRDFINQIISGIVLAACRPAQKKSSEVGVHILPPTLRLLHDFYTGKRPFIYKTVFSLFYAYTAISHTTARSKCIYHITTRVAALRFGPRSLVDVANKECSKKLHWRVGV